MRSIRPYLCDLGRWMSRDWFFPVASAVNGHLPTGVKLNTDGCRYGSTGKAGFGGIFRDHKGIWVLGNYGKLSCNDQAFKLNFGVSIEA